MNTHMTDSNVYFLPAPATEPEPRANVRPNVWRRLRNAWWRLRLAIAEIHSILRHPPQRFSVEDYADFLAGDTEVIVRPRPRRSRPARVIDFEAARLRLRAVPPA